MLEAAEIYEALCQRHTKEKQDKLKNARVAVAGLGGLGSHVSIALARLGIGSLRLIDYDVVDITNIFRQSYYLQHIGQYKTDSMKAQIAEINPYIKVESITEKITQENVMELMGEADIICEALDRKESKAMLINEIMEHSRNKIIVSGNGMAGMDSGNRILTRKVTDRFYVCGDGVSSLEDGLQLMAPRVALCAMHEANMVMRILLGETEE
ncbi:MAG: sulfur carrier protein ThiS adenylyltransferase ThiF [Lachnospiraceae bacterium]|nr:sulfur carrier protein ThiS adenylyltransferase ThiF [Lachnospiraceae bacterium]